jgi:hypothetical protein
LKRYEFDKMGIVASAQQKVNIETSESNIKKLATLLKTLHTGELNKSYVRPPMRLTDMAKIVGVNRKTFAEWRDGLAMPQPANLRAIARDLLLVREQELEKYFFGEITLQQLLEIRPKAANLEEIYQLSQHLPEPDRDVLLARLLQDRVKNLGNETKKNKRNQVSSTKCIEDTDLASNLGEGLNPKAAERLQNLLIVSRSKHSRLAGENLDFYEILERQGIEPSPFIEVVEAAATRRISELYGPRLFSEDWYALSVICFQIVGWRHHHPTELLDVTYHGHIGLLKRSLTENGEPHPSVRH